MNLVGVASPGPDIILVTRYATRSRRHAIAAAAGIQIGVLFWCAATVFGAAALLTDFRAVAAAGLRQSPHAPVQGIAAQRALRLAEAAIQRLGAQVNPKIVLSVFAAKFRAL